MYEELIERLREYPDREENADGYVEIDWQDLLDAADAIESLTDQLAATKDENGSKDKEIERLAKKATLSTFVKYAMKRACEDLVDAEADLTRVEAERDAAKKCIYDIETYLAFGSAQYIGRTIQAWKSGAQGEA